MHKACFTRMEQPTSSARSTRRAPLNGRAAAIAGNELDEAALAQIRDPQCANVSALQNLRNSCTLNAVAEARQVRFSFRISAGDTRQFWFACFGGPGIWRFDANIAKAVKVSETKTVQFRLDATNVFNHPEPNTPIFDINNANFELITGVNAKSTLHRQFQAQLRFNFKKASLDACINGGPEPDRQGISRSIRGFSGHYRCDCQKELEASRRIGSSYA